MSNIRNLALLSAKGTGKTSLAEAILFNAKITKRIGRVEDGNTIMDFDQEEIDRGISLVPSICSFDYNKQRVHIVDTAGYPDFINEVKIVLRAVDNAIFLVSGVEGVKSQGVKFWRILDESDKPRIVFINSMDKELANFKEAWNSLRQSFEMSFIPICIPAVRGNKLVGVIDLIKMKFFEDKGDKSGTSTESDIPDDFTDFADDYREKLIESVAESNDELMERYLEGEELSPEEIATALRKGAADNKLCPVLSGSATSNIGVTQLMDYFGQLSAAPERNAEIKVFDKNGNETTIKTGKDDPFCATVFKTMVDQYAGKLSIFRVLSGTVKADTNITISEKDRKAKISHVFMVKGKEQKQVDCAEPGDIACVVKIDEIETKNTICDQNNVVRLPELVFPDPVLALAVVPAERGDEDKLSRGLSSMLEEDPLLKTKRDEQTKQLTVCGTGQVHLDSVVSRLKKRFQLNIQVSPPEIPYRETITKATKYVEYTHKKQSGGAGQFARVFIDMEPTQRGEGYDYVDKIFGGSIDQNFRPSVDKGIRQKMAEGILAGYPVVDVRVSLVDGKTHPVDSKDIAFQTAGREVFKKAAMMCNPILLEPVMNVEIEIPDECMGDVIGDINSRRGRVSTTEQASGATIVKAQIPLSEMLRYAPDLDSMSSGRGTFTMEPSTYEEVPKRVADEIISRYNKQKEEEV
ncbi:MAG TPA: elongation factor G [bacterium]|nr:elongation factor G [bacterium]